MSEDVVEGPWTGHPALQPVREGKEVSNRHRDLWRNVALAAPLVLVTTVAMIGQVGWFYQEVHKRGTPVALAVMVAVLASLALETISLFAAAEAHFRLMRGDPAGPVRVLSYAVAGFAGIINWWHWSPGVIAVVFGVMSALAPWLWAIRSRSLRRAELRLIGALDEPSVKFGWRRWVLHPRRAWPLYRAAVWDGVTDPAKALALTLAVPCSSTDGARHDEVAAEVTLPRIVVKPHAPRSPEADRVVEVRALLKREPNLSARRLAETGRYGSKSTCATLLTKAKERA
jgi:hypothetical protein